MSPKEVAVLLDDSRERNAADGITGLLVHIRFDRERTAFLQVLEGPRDAVERTFARIERDELHTGVTVLRNAPIAETRFQRWSMKFVSVDEQELRDKVLGELPAADALRDLLTMEQLITTVG